VAKHLGLFDEVMATSRAGNLKGEAKAARIVERSGERASTTSATALPTSRCGGVRAMRTWSRARSAFPRASAASVPVKRVFRPAARRSCSRRLRALRPHQWAKNLLLFVPLVAAHRVADACAAVATACRFVRFCLLASARTS
jgi:hypothetical protein